MNIAPAEAESAAILPMRARVSSSLIAAQQKTVTGNAIRRAVTGGPSATPTNRVDARVNKKANIARAPRAVRSMPGSARTSILRTPGGEALTKSVRSVGTDDADSGNPDRVPYRAGAI